MREPRRLTPLWASTARYRDSFTFIILQEFVDINFCLSVFNAASTREHSEDILGEERYGYGCAVVYGGFKAMSCLCKNPKGSDYLLLEWNYEKYCHVI
jgi:hypothetical protein